MILNEYNFDPGKENAPLITLFSPSEQVGIPKQSQLCHLRIHHQPVTKKMLQTLQRVMESFVKSG